MNSMAKTKAQIIIAELLGLGVSKELLAIKFQKTHRTIERWASGETEPLPIELTYLRRILSGYKNAKA